MKKNLIAAFFAFAALSATSCSSDDNNNSNNNQNPTAAEINSVVTSGAWRITNYIDNGNNETSDFANYNFVFGGNNTISASNGTNTYSGIWFTDSDDDDNDVDLNINFSSPQLFAELTEDWDVIELTSTKIRLQDNDDDGTDYLTFEKN